MLTFLGDVALLENDSRSTYIPDSPYVFNLEYVIGAYPDRLRRLNKINISSSNYEFSEFFGKNPVAVSIANNHIFDYGYEGYLQTKSILENQNISMISSHLVVELSNCFLVAYSMLEDDAGFREIAFTYDRVKETIDNLKKINSDYSIIVQIHWGIENHPMMDKQQKKIGHWLIDQGVDLVIGHHPHCIQPVELYKGKYIFYSLGNTVFDSFSMNSHYDSSGISHRVYRIRQQKWNKESLAVVFDEYQKRVVRVDKLMYKNKHLSCKKKVLKIKHTILKSRFLNNCIFLFRKYFAFIVSNSFVDGKFFDFEAVYAELKNRVIS